MRDAYTLPEMLPVAGTLVFMLYVLLFHEILTYLNSRGTSDEAQTVDKEQERVNALRPCKAPQPAGSHYGIGGAKRWGSLDNLWRRMKNASTNFEMNRGKRTVIRLGTNSESEPAN